METPQFLGMLATIAGLRPNLGLAKDLRQLQAVWRSGVVLAALRRLLIPHAHIPHSTSMARASALCALLLLAFLVGTTSAITCSQVVSYISPCVPYAKSGGPIPPGCCPGIKSLLNAARTTPDRQTACNCLKSLANPKLGLNPAIVANIPKNCGVNIPYPISPNTDCSKVT